MHHPAKSDEIFFKVGTPNVRIQSESKNAPIEFQLYKFNNKRSYPICSTLLSNTNGLVYVTGA